MKPKFTITLVAFFVFALSSPAQLLWKITGNGIKNPSYLFGTHHVAPLSICDSIAGFNEAFDSCNQFYGELDMSNMQAIAQEVSAFMMLPQDNFLDVMLTPEQYRQVDSLLKQEAGVGADQMKMLKPAVIEAQLGLIMCTKAFGGFNPNQQPDMFLQHRAKEKGISVKGFETALFQAEALYGAPLAEQVSDLMRTVNQFGALKDQLIAMNQAYMNQNLSVLQKYVENPEFTTPRTLDRLIYERNHHWADQLKTILPQESTFIVVGAGHLPGEQGLLELLRGQGYTVTAVR